MESLTDAWSWLNYKPVMSAPIRIGVGLFGDLVGAWVSPDDLRRSQAYKVLSTSYGSSPRGWR